MLNKEMYLQIEEEFERWRIDEEVEDVLLDMAELLADKGVMGKEIRHQEKFGKIKVEVCGICSVEEDSEEEISVRLLWIKIGKKEYEINDYIL